MLDAVGWMCMCVMEGYMWYIIISKNIIYESVQIANVTNRVQYTRYIWLAMLGMYIMLCVYYLRIQCYTHAILQYSDRGSSGADIAGTSIIFEIGSAQMGLQSIL